MLLGLRVGVAFSAPGRDDNGMAVCRGTALYIIGALYRER